MPFNSAAATLIARVKNSVFGNILQLEKNEPDAQALIQDLKLVFRDLHYSQLIDVRDIFKTLSTETMKLMVADIANSENYHLPFTNTGFWFADDWIGFCSDYTAEDGHDVIDFTITHFYPDGQISTIPRAAQITKGDDTLVFNAALTKLSRWEDIKVATTSAYTVSAVMMFLLEHKRIEINDIVVPVRRNTKRQKRGKLPYSEYKEVAFTQSIKPHGEHQGGTHASPRFHVRAGHWRHLSRERKVWIRAALVGDPSRGSIIKTYKLDTPVNA